MERWKPFTKKIEVSKPENTNEIKPSEVTLPHAEAAIALYKENFKNEEGLEKQIENLKEIFQIFAEQGIANTEVFNSKENGASFPWTVIKMPELVRELYKKNGKEFPTNLKPYSPSDKGERTFAKQQEFIFGSAFAASHGDEFVFAEEAMNQVINHLPRALEDIKAGKEPENFEVFMAGMPTNEFGSISKEFSENLKKDSYEHMGRLYADFVAEKSSGEANGKKAVELYGISMGGGFAAKTGEKLLQKGNATQDFEKLKAEDSEPFLQIKAMVPVSMGRKRNKNWQIKLGFATNGIREMLMNPGVKIIGAKMKDFQEKTTALLEKKGIHKNMSKEEAKIKHESNWTIINSLGQNLEIDKSVKLTKIVGLKDPTMYTKSFNKNAYSSREQSIKENNA